MSAKRSRIDISLEGVGKGTARRPASIDVPLDGRRPASHGAVLMDPQLERMVNQHHEEIKELHRRARQGGK